MTKPCRLNCGFVTELQNDLFILRLFFARRVHTDSETQIPRNLRKDKEQKMRSKEMLLDKFEDIKTLQQYLYMDKDHNVVFHNSLDVPLRLRMKGNGEYMCQSLNFPDLPESCWANEMTINTTLAIIDVLEEEPAVEFPKEFANRWAEIKAITALQISANKHR